jgi:hypothetical protein
MLYDPKWDKPSVAGFRAWLERQDPEATFNYCDCNGCAVGQYLDSVGTSWHDASAFLVSELNVFAFRAAVNHDTVVNHNTDRSTFGAVLREMDRAA